VRIPLPVPVIWRQTRYRCEADDWEFDARYTEGACPICGWQPEGAPHAPRWLTLSRKVDWEMVGLFALFVVLVFCAVIISQAAGFRLPHPGR
jgi:hypothetical protein